MDWNQTISEVRELIYQCQFKSAVAAVDMYCQSSSSPSVSDYFTLQLRKSMALFEMHRVAESKSVLRDLTQYQQKQSDAYLYATARLAYMDQEYEMAERLFKLLADRSETVKDYFQAVLGLANVYFSLRMPQDIGRLTHEMEELEDLVNLDQRISLYLLRAMVADRFEQDSQLAKKFFHMTIREASPLRWNYFTIKSLYGLACMYKDMAKLDALEVSLDLLHCYLDPEECAYLTYLVNEKFKDLDYSLTCSMQMDPDLRRLCVQGKWIPLHDKPLIYDFLELLYNRGSFVNKAEIAARLWPDEEYKPRTHDPRIFDLARRIRALIEPYENQPVCLLSGRQGYKLAGRDSSTTRSDQDFERRPLYEARESI
jgi:DNA-binding winged helix-turn-helix (wHTH) protein